MCRAIALAPRRVRINGPPVFLEPNTAQAIAVALHELVTNAVNMALYPFRPVRSTCNWSHEAGGCLKLHWREIGGPVVRMPTRKGFGGRIIEQAIAHLKGKTCLEWTTERDCLRNHSSDVKSPPRISRIAGNC